ncbi:MAG UNVERIFIED_CONTAM: hypothetical protein LVQ98_01060 [Rickettsiaceae bacterium]|jgi:histidine phosphotransferase ChpT
MIKDIDFIQIFAAKLFHDLAGTLGAISSAIEFVQSDDVEVKKKALELMELSSTQANDKLRFFRYAYGISKYSGDADLATVRELCLLLAKDKRVGVEFLAPGSITNEQSMDVNTGKLIVCLASLAKSALIHGGQVKISWEKQAPYSIIISATGPDLKPQTEAHDIICSSSQNAINTTNVHAYYIQRLISNNNIKLDIKTSDDAISYVIYLGK